MVDKVQFLNRILVNQLEPTYKYIRVIIRYSWIIADVVFQTNENKSSNTSVWVKSLVTQLVDTFWWFPKETSRFKSPLPQLLNYQKNPLPWYYKPMKTSHLIQKYDISSKINVKKLDFCIRWNEPLNNIPQDRKAFVSPSCQYSLL